MGTTLQAELKVSLALVRQAAQLPSNILPEVPIEVKDKIARRIGNAGNRLPQSGFIWKCL
jgi:hypothetical protein